MAFKQDMGQLFDNIIKGENLFAKSDVTHDASAQLSAAQTSFMTANNANIGNAVEDQGRSV